ncbi:hypothetical protein [Candidatus Palauibacter sp.]|uniref:hypothetical protein n=1 Tax=Candidatus Palauibacter sp. TaxID=3101350 RepID=UPI003B5233D1
MIENARRSIHCALIVALALGTIPGVVSAQAPEESVPVRNVQLFFHLVEADGFTDDDPEISDVVSELRKLFNFEGYRLLSTSVLNVGLARTSNVTLGGTGSQRVFADDSETPLTIRAEVTTRRYDTNVRAKVTLVEFMALSGALLEASVTIRDGQRVVLGSARRSAGEPILILIVTPRIDQT